MQIKVLFLLYFIFSCGMVYAEDLNKKQTTSNTTVYEETLTTTIKSSVSVIDLKVRTADGREFDIEVDRQKFETQGFKAVSHKICPSPMKKISENCVECKNGDVICKK